MPRRHKQNNSVIDYPTLRAERARLAMQYADMVEAASANGGEPPCMQTICRFMRGDEDMKVNTIKRLAAALGLKPRVTFEPIDQSAPTN